jgi:hypothetical protein
MFVAPHQDAALAEHEDAAKRDLSSLSKLPASSRLRAFAPAVGRLLGARRRLRSLGDLRSRPRSRRRAGQLG